MIVDAHQHLWTADYAWLADPALAPIRRDDTVADLRGCLSAAGVDRTVLVEAARCSADETYEFLAVAAETPEIAGVVGWASLTDPALRDTLEGYRAAPGGDLLVGVRDQVQGRSDDYLMAPAVHAGLRTIADLGLVNELVVTESQLPSVVFAASSVPSTFVLDHLGKPRSFATWRVSAAQRARFVLCGRQGPARSGARRPAGPDLRRYRDRDVRLGPHPLKIGAPALRKIRGKYADPDGEI